MNPNLKLLDRNQTGSALDALISYLRRGYGLFIVSAVWILSLLATWDIRQSFVSGIALNDLVFGNFWEINNLFGWLPLSVEVAHGNLFPIDPLLGQGNSSIEFFPYLSIWFVGLLVSLFGVGGALLVGKTVLPVLSFIFMVLIFRRYLLWRWSISISALGILAFNSAPFRDFLLSLFTGVGWRELGVLNPPDSMGFPFPAISLLSFLIVFYFSLQRTYMSTRRMTILSIAWGLQSQINILNLVFGFPFWIVYLALVLWRSNNNRWSSQQSKQLLSQAGIVGIFCLPTVFLICAKVNIEGGWRFLAGVLPESATIDWFSLFAYFLLPLVALKLAYWVIRIDPYELAVKFLPVWVAMAVELFLILAWQLFGIGIPSELLFNRLSLFFLHLFYFTPAIYYLQRPNMEYHAGTEGLEIPTKIRLFLIWFFRDASLVYLPLFVVMLTGFGLASSEKAFYHFKEVGVPAYRETEEAFILLTEEKKPGDVLIGPNTLSNLLLSLRGQHGSLWTHRIASKIDIDSAIERFATYARIMGWNEDQFLDFMMPSDLSFGRTPKLFNLALTDPIPGLGYWMVFQYMPQDAEGEKKLSGHLQKLYSSLNIEHKLKEYNVKRIIIRGKPKFNVNAPVRNVKGYSIIDLSP